MAQSGETRQIVAGGRSAISGAVTDGLKAGRPRGRQQAAKEARHGAQVKVQEYRG